MLHAVCVMSNHRYGVVTDPDARMPEFLEMIGIPNVFFDDEGELPASATLEFARPRIFAALSDPRRAGTPVHE